MKKNLFQFCAVCALLVLMACNSKSESELATNSVTPVVAEEVETPANDATKNNFKVFEDFIYEIAPRFSQITKTELGKLRKFSDLIEEEYARDFLSYETVSITVLEGEEETYIKAIGGTNEFNAAQLELLQSVDHSTNLLFRADYTKRNKDHGGLEDHYWTPYLSVVPEKQAMYEGGTQALKDFLKAESEAVRANVDPEKLRPAKLIFTVTKTGAVENIKLDRTSYYPEVDKKMIELIQMAPGSWEPAENAQGEKVDQELVISFGLRGC